MGRISHPSLCSSNYILIYCCFGYFEKNVCNAETLGYIEVITTIEFAEIFRFTLFPRLLLLQAIVIKNLKFPFIKTSFIIKLRGGFFLFLFFFSF